MNHVHARLQVLCTPPPWTAVMRKTPPATTAVAARRGLIAEFFPPSALAHLAPPRGSCRAREGADGEAAGQRLATATNF
jgi:hypothetical protein